MFAKIDKYLDKSLLVWILFHNFAKSKKFALRQVLRSKASPITTINQPYY